MLVPSKPAANTLAVWGGVLSTVIRHAYRDIVLFCKFGTTPGSFGPGIVSRTTKSILLSEDLPIYIVNNMLTILPINYICYYNCSKKVRWEKRQGNYLLVIINLGNQAPNQNIVSLNPNKGANYQNTAFDWCLITALLSVCRQSTTSFSIIFWSFAHAHVYRGYRELLIVF